MRRMLSLDSVLIVAIALTLSCTDSFAQSPPHRKKPKIKDFGSSLKRLSWDPFKKEVVDTRRRDQKPQSNDEDDVVRVNTTLVTCEVLVMDEQGRTVQGLTANDFVISEDNTPQVVGHFLLGDNANLPRTIVLIFDYSGSQAPYLLRSVAAAKVLVDKLGPLDRMAIVTDDVELIADFTDDKAKLKKKLDSLVERTKSNGGFLGFGGGQRFGKSAQYSALMATLREAFDDEDLRPIVVFQTDGDEIFSLREPIIVPTVPPGLPPDLRQESEIGVRNRLEVLQKTMRNFSLKDLYQQVERSHATIYTVIPGAQLIGLPFDEQLSRLKTENEKHLRLWTSQLPQADREQIEARQEDRWERTPPEALKFQVAEAVKVQSVLVHIASLAGGWTEFLETPTRADEIYSRIFSDINQRYIVGYYPTNKEQNGTRRRISIAISGHPDYVVVGRKWYYAPNAGSN